MRLLTLNCHAWQEDDQLNKINTLVKTIVDNDYDVIALQEVSQKEDSPLISEHIREDNYGQVVLDKLKKIGKSSYHLVWASCHQAFNEYEEGLAIITKHPIQHVEKFYLSKSTDYYFWKTRVALVVDIEVEGEIQTFMSCHLGWWHDVEEPSAYQLDRLNYIASQKDNRVFLLGDFNSEAKNRDEGYDYLVAKGWYDTYSLATERDSGVTVSGEIAGWKDHDEDKRIDFIFVNSLISVKSSMVIFNGNNSEVISDHFGVDVIID
ncbi:endonuclease/exonuclease/phosphatase family protein [Gracilibacillus thailandensis]|uniref:Endonuclease n=1 Tax=Gracilibacillus thailandensis TaxID=563735 RepID=A0A6N7QY18_9BACI|nr:endonuclease/exonuclease/phosphatase family protein [Gracilibacillus thailandensis]MRI65775.1 endonuclease [Gracilibacillus thailandensis]